jgi:hypothetical protein
MAAARVYFLSTVKFRRIMTVTRDQVQVVVTVVTSIATTGPSTKELKDIRISMKKSTITTKVK